MNLFDEMYSPELLIGLLVVLGIFLLFSEIRIPWRRREGRESTPQPENGSSRTHPRRRRRIRLGQKKGLPNTKTPMT